jgi:spore coat protein A
MSKSRNCSAPLLSRRRFLEGGAAAPLLWHARGWAQSATSDVGLNPLMFISPPIERFVDDLFVLPRQAAGGELVASRARHRFHRDLAVSDTLAFGSLSYLGPVLEAQSGQQVTQAFRNEIDRHPLAAHIDPTVHGVSELDRELPRTTIHLHGGVTEPGSDGHPIASLRRGQVRVHTYSGRQEAMGLWYHDHAMGTTRLNVYAGLAGPYLIRDAWDTGADDNPLELPAGEFELVLVLQDKIFTSDGALGFRLATYVEEGRWEGGQAGDVPVVNGVAYPRHGVARALYRVRLLNASNLRSYRLSFSNGMRFWQIGTDAGLLNAPVALTELLLAAGQRVDLLVDFAMFSSGTRVQLRNTELLPLQFLVAVGDARIDEIMQFHVADALGPRRSVPASLRGGQNQPPPLPDVGAYERVRTMTLLQAPDQTRFPPAVMSLNNLGFTTDDVEIVRPGTVERWDIINTTTDPHPVHLHMALLRVLSRQPYASVAYLLAEPLPAHGVRWAPPADPFMTGPEVEAEPWEAGWHDTIDMPPGQITRLLVRWPALAELGFDPDATFPVPDTVESGAPVSSGAHEASHDKCRGAPPPANHDHGEAAAPTQMSAGVQPTGSLARGYVWHCHVLDHEDHDMMLPLRLVGG